MKLFGLTGTSALVTGAASGIGQASCLILGELGARITAVDVATCDATAALMAEQGTPLDAVRLCDITDKAAVDSALAPGFDILVHSAAICPWTDWEAECWEDEARRVMDVNVNGTLHVLRAAFRHLQDGGRIVLVSSLAGRNGGLIAAPHYVASKGAMNALVKWAARRAGPRGICVNGVAPASIRTPMMAGRQIDVSSIPLGRVGQPQDVAGPIAFLCSPAAAFVTGVVLDVNGGVYMAP